MLNGEDKAQRDIAIYHVCSLQPDPIYYYAFGMLLILREKYLLALLPQVFTLSHVDKALLRCLCVVESIDLLTQIANYLMELANLMISKQQPIL